MGQTKCLRMTVWLKNRPLVYLVHSLTGYITDWLDVWMTG